MDDSKATERQLGILIGKMEGIEKRLDRADDSRAKLHQRVDMIAENVSQIDAKVILIESSMDRLEPAVAMVNNMKAKAAGAVLVLVSLGAVMWWVFSAFAGEIRNAIIKLFS